MELGPTLTLSVDSRRASRSRARACAQPDNPAILALSPHLTMGPPDTVLRRRCGAVRIAPSADLLVHVDVAVKVGMVTIHLFTVVKLKPRQLSVYAVRKK